MIKVHTFSGLSTGEVYDETQCREDIKMGDVLVVPNEQVVGFLLSAWPVAVTVKTGRFHYKNPNSNWNVVCNQPGDKMDFMLSVAKAIEVANQLGWPVGDRNPDEPDEPEEEQPETPDHWFG